MPVLGLGVAIAGNIYVGMPEASFFVIGRAAVYAVVRLVQERRRMPLRVSLARLGGAGLLGLMLAAPLLLLFLQYESLSFNMHKPEFDMGTDADPQWGLLNWIVPFFPERTVAHGAVRNWFGVAVGISALVALSGRTETKRLHAWLFVALGGALLAQDLRLRRARLGRPVAGRRADRLSDVRGARRLVRVCGAGGDRRSGAVESRPPTAALSDAPRVGVDCCSSSSRARATAGA